jgi:hypothetical protein
MRGTLSVIFVVVSLTRLIFSMGNLPKCIGLGRCQKKGMEVPPDSRLKMWFNKPVLSLPKGSPPTPLDRR